MRAAIAEALGKASSAAITVEDMATLTTLYAQRDRDIKDLTGHEFATNLTQFRRDRGLRMLIYQTSAPLAGLTKMREIYFHDTHKN